MRAIWLLCMMGLKCLALLLTLSAAAQAQDQILERAWFEDRSGQLRLAEVQTQAFTVFDGLLVRGYSSSTFWVRLRVADILDGLDHEPPWAPRAWIGFGQLTGEHPGWVAALLAALGTGLLAIWRSRLATVAAGHAAVPLATGRVARVRSRVEIGRSPSWNARPPPPSSPGFVSMSAGERVDCGSIKTLALRRLAKLQRSKL